jgi:catechol 2,3-dioxygenase-like lactoylglutathione lyase family enzyme
VNWQPHPDPRGELVVVVDCADLERAARFWTAVLGYTAIGDSDGGDQGLVPAGGFGIEVLLQRTADAKQGKNRVHLDLRTRDLEAEVSRVTALGATVLTRLPIVEDGWTWHVLADPDGNEFCILRPPPHYFLKDEDQRFNGGLLPEITSRCCSTRAGSSSRAARSGRSRQDSW